MKRWLNPSTPKQPAATPQPRSPSGASTPDEVQELSKESLELHGGRRGAPREPGELAAILERYRDNSISTSEKRKQSKGTIFLLSKMEEVSVQLGDFATYGGRGNTGNLAHQHEIPRQKQGGLYG